MSTDQQSQRSIRLGGIGLVNLATFSWATNMALGRYLRDDIGPLALAAARFLIASAFFAVLLRRQPPEERRLGKDRWLLVGMAVSGVIVFAPVLYLGLRYTTAVNSTLINGTAPLITGVLAALLIGEKMSRRQVWGSLVGLIGVIILISGGRFPFWQGMGNVGDLIVLAAVGLWAVYSVLGRQVMRRRSALSTTAFSAFLGLPVLLLAAAWEMRTLAVDFGPRLVGAILYIGIVPTVGGFLAWNVGVRRLGPSGAMVFYNTLPLYGTLIGSLFLGESIGWNHLLGGVLIVGGGWWAARASKRT